jgi:hypothetical protein
MRQDSNAPIAQSVPAARVAPTPDQAQTPELPELPRNERAMSLIAGVCTCVIVLSTTLLMMPTPAIAADHAACPTTELVAVQTLRP